jgi:2-polyprenyl-3-methyl-5-hydroxy-6-metoxy-1,4-benzoquinol methylase
MSLIGRALMGYVRSVGGGLPGERLEAGYLCGVVKPGSIVVDAGGGDGKLAHQLAQVARLALVLDREETCLEGADNTLYKGSLDRLMRTRTNPRVVPIMGDATRSPLAAGSVDAIVSSQVLEHLPVEAKRAFFEECARCLKPSGILAVTTPSQDFYATDPLWFSRFCRKILPKSLIARLPHSLRGPWLEQTLEEWEAKAGHYGHGCRMEELSSLAAESGLETVHHRCTHTRLAIFWFDLLATFPLLGLLATPLARVAYAIEWRLPARPGGNLLVQYRNTGRPVRTASRPEAVLVREYS